jgi:hypothetical protein
MKLLKPPIYLGPSDPNRDEADAGGYPLRALEALLSDCRSQPDWRDRADRAHRFYDMGKQLTPQKAAKIRMEWGIEPRQTNIIHGVINGVLGAEAKARTDVRVEADEDEFADLCDVFNVQLKQATREAFADMAISNAYGAGVKGGIGWCEVSLATDPLDPWLRVRDIHRREIWWDMRAKDLGLADARWMVRTRWEDLDEAVALMPQFKDILIGAVGGYDYLNLPDESFSTGPLQIAQWNERRTTIQRDEWCETSRRRIKFYEVWYRANAEVVVLHTSPTRRVQFDPKNPLHRVAVERGIGKLAKAPTRQVRMALFAGPHRLIDVGTARRRFPYVPFFAFRDDEDRSPYGLIEGMISPQEEYNERRQIWNWMALARQVIVDADALDGVNTKLADLQREAKRPDMMAVLNPKRTNVNGLKIGQDLGLSREHYEGMQDAKALVQEVSRVYGPQLGDAPAGVTSGYAINSLVEQGMVAMGELNDNYAFFRHAVHEEVLGHIIERHMDEELRVKIGRGKSARVVVLNSWTPEGEPLNRVKDAPMRVGFSEVPNSPAYRMQEQQQLSLILQALAALPQAVAVLAPAFVEGSGLANRQALADSLRRALGMPDPGDRGNQDEAEAQAAQAKQAEQAMQQAAIETEMRGKAAKAWLDEANARLADAKAASLGAPQEPIPDEAAAMDEEQAIQEALAEAMGSRTGVPGARPGTLH